MRKKRIQKSVFGKTITIYAGGVAIIEGQPCYVGSSRLGTQSLSFSMLEYVVRKRKKDQTLSCFPGLLDQENVVLWTFYTEFSGLLAVLLSGSREVLL